MLSRVPTWAECHAAGMTASQAAQARGRHKSCATAWARRRGLRFADGRSVPEFRAHLKRIAVASAANRNAWRGQLTATELADYQLFMSHGYRRAEALKAIGREDLI